MAHHQRRTYAIAASNSPAYTGVQALEKGPENCHFVPLFGTFGAASGRDGSIGNALQHHEIGHDLCSAGPSQKPGGMRKPEKLPQLAPPDVHYPKRTSLPRCPGRPSV
jgi:hypothetical protein